MTRRDLALIALAGVTVLAYTVVLIVVVVIGGDIAETMTATVAALTPLTTLGGVAIGRISAGPQQPPEGALVTTTIETTTEDVTHG